MAVRRIYKVVEEHLFEVDELDHMVKGRISYCPDMPKEVGAYYWEISHFYKPSAAAAGIYYPSNRNATSLEGARESLFMYASGLPGADLSPSKY
ncbi:hypothetical protein V2K91_05895 [Pseudomonas alliivorans]|nr:hypothetical protein [Pseudomonas alliivorans]